MNKYIRSIPNLYFEINPMKAELISWIELFYHCGHTGQIKPMARFRDDMFNPKRPIAFKWHNPKACTVTPELIEWIHTEFIPAFEIDTFKWQVGIYTSPKELQCHLSGHTNN